MNQEILPIFKTSASIGRSILTVEDETEINDNSPVSVIAIAQKYKLDKIIVIDSSFINFPSLYKSCKKHKIQLIYGIEFTICNDVKDKTDASLFSNCKVAILIKNSEGYKDLIKLHDRINGNAENFYYSPRGSWDILQESITDNLELIFPAFDNFIHANMLKNGKCLPNLGKLKPIITFANMDLPYQEILNKAIKNYAINNNFELFEVHPIHYLDKKAFLQFQVYRCISERTKYNAPNIPFLCSNKFSFEEYCNKTNQKFNIND